MVSVFIAHHPSDKDVAEDLALHLKPSSIHSQLGHTAQDVWAFGKNAECVIIIWSASSVSSPYIYEIVTTIPDFRLMHLVVKGVNLEDIPETVRSSKLVSAANYGIIAKGILARAKENALGDVMFSLRPLIRKPITEEERAEAARREARAKVQKEVLRAEAGKLVHKIPSSMTLNVEEVIEVRLGRAEAQGLTMGLMGGGPLAEEDLLVVETMTVMLHCGGSAFHIAAEARPTQLVNGQRFRASRFEDFGKWTWRVTPKKLGNQELRINVSAELLDSQGIPASTSLPTRTLTVRVRVNYPQLSTQALRWGTSGVLGALFAGVIGAYTQDIWWPAIKVWMQSHGWLH